MSVSNKEDWAESIMLHGWPESGPGSLSLEDLYQMFKARMELERHKPECWLRDAGEKCTCGLAAAQP